MDNNQLDGQTDLARFLEKFNRGASAADFAASFPVPFRQDKPSSSVRQEQYNRSFEKLEEKIRELEEKFEASAAQNEAVMRELARTREAVENQKSKDAFFANISATIANLKESVENLSRARQTPRLYDPAPAPGRAFDAPAQTPAGEYLSMAYYQPDSYRAAHQAKLQAERLEKEQALQDLRAERGEKERALQNLQTVSDEKSRALAALLNERGEKDRALADLRSERLEKEEVVSRLQQSEQDLVHMLDCWKREHEAKTRELDTLHGEKEEKARIISSLQQKASQLKAVNVALDREIKRVQEERTEALRKSAEQAKEILSLRDALTAAEERFKSFDFEGRIISVKRQYEQKVNKLETQLHEISNTCMKQVEEIESLKAENLKLHQIAEEREQLAALYEAKTRELEALQASVAELRAETDNQNQSRLAAFTHRMQRLQEEHEALSVRLTRAQDALQTVSAEKQTLEQNFKTLLSKIEQNDAVIEELKRKIAVLTEENRELKKDRQTPKPAARAPQAPREPVTVRQPLPQQPHQTVRRPAAKPAAAAPESAPVEMQNTLRPKVRTEADLPEIRVAEPVPQEELYNGEDFLEKTDSFIGRMKWSIFREDK